MSTMNDANDALVRTTQTGTVRTLWLNRPEALNSFNSALHAALAAAFDDAAADHGVRCVVLGAVGRAFCAGQDLADPLVAPDSAPGAQPKDLGHVIESLYAPLVMRLRSMPVPVIARVQGVAAGAGANLALCCDLVVAGESATFIQAFTRIGLVPDTGGTWLLPRLVGQARAMGLALLGDKLPAAEAAQMGLIWKCVPDADLGDTVDALAARLAAMPLKALVATRQALADAQRLDLPDALAMEARLQRGLGAATDYREGVEAFGAKRPPTFTER